MARINCSHLDVSKGIYENLRSSVSSVNALNDKGNSTTGFGDTGIEAQLPVDSSLTNSEISILSKYANEQVANAPQYLLASLWKWCVGNYNITEYQKDGETKYRINDDLITCMADKNQRNLFNYRASFELNNMQGVLAYALKTSDYTDQAFMKDVEAQISHYKSVPICLMLAGIFDVIILISQYVLYSNRKGCRDLTSLPRFLLHIVTGLTVGGFILSAIAAGSITLLLRVLEHGINENFGSFGIHLQLGKPWFTLVWLAFGANFFLAFSWIIPTWCANPPEQEQFNENYYSRSGDIGKRVATRNMRSTSVNSDDPKHRMLYQSSSGSSGSETDLDSESEESSPRETLFGRANSKTSKSSKSKSKAKMTDPEDTFDLIDDLESYVSPFNDKNELETRKNPIFQFDYPDQEENKLRKLGETLSRNTSVRHLNQRLNKNKTNKRLESVDEFMMSKEEAQNFIYDHNSHSPLPHHYRVETFDGFGNPSRNITKPGPGPVATSPTDENNENNPFSVNYHTSEPSIKKSNSIPASSSANIANMNKLNKSNSLQHTKSTSSKRAKESSIRDSSYLDDDEINYMESNPYINRMGR